ncbi:ABC transporter substrate-binding protein [Vibrio cholerae]
MKHIGWLAIVLLWSAFSVANEVSSPLRIYGAAYQSEMKPMLDDFKMRHPEVKIDYRWMSSNDLDRYIRDNIQPQPDITISSVMDLQLRLVNDGYALPHKIAMSSYATSQSVLPEWSQWRDELFGFSFEPAVLVFNKAFIDGKVTPMNRVELLSFIRQYSSELVGKIGLFDIRRVGIGYLLWSFERQQARNYGQFLELFNSAQARTFGSTRSMLKAASEGELLMAYNVLGSYARSWQELDDNIVIVSLTDYTPVIIRSAFINKTTQQPDAAKAFIDYILSLSGQWVMAEQTNMPPIRTDITSEKSAAYLRQHYAEQLNPIPLDVRLMVFSDQSKREVVTTEWESALKNYD